MAHLVLAVHTVEAATAKVPFSMILLLDHAKRKTIPEGMRVRMIVPSGGLTSVSLWDCEDPVALKTWLDENLGADCVSEVSEVEEEFTFGIAMELASARAAEKMTASGLKTIGALGEKTSRAAEIVAAGVGTAVATTSERLGEWDKRTGVLTQAKATTAATYSRMAEVVAKAAENEKVQNVVSNVQQGVSTGWTQIRSWVGTKLGEQGLVQQGGTQGHNPHVFQDNQYGFSADSLDRPLSRGDDDLTYDHYRAPAAGAHASGAAAPAAPAVHTLGSEGGDVAPAVAAPAQSGAAAPAQPAAAGTAASGGIGPQP